MRNAYIICRTPGTAADQWHHIYPRGEFPIVAEIKGKKKQVDLILDDDAYNRIIAAFREQQQEPNFSGILVAQEHFAQRDDASSEAAAWIDEFEIRPDGLWARYGEITDLGERLIGKRYKFRSPVSDIEHIAGNRYRPVNVVDVGLTNKPQFKTLAAAMAREGRNPQEDEMLERILAIFGLQEGASEDQVLARVQQAKDAETQTETAKQQLTELGNQVLAREADEFIAANKDLIEDNDEARAAVKTQFVAARETTETCFKLLRKQAPKAPEAPQRVLSRDTAQVPDGTLDQSQTDRDRVQARSAKQNDLIRTVQRDRGITSYLAAREIARGIKPELFKD